SRIGGRSPRAAPRRAQAWTGRRAPDLLRSLGRAGRSPGWLDPPVVHGRWSDGTGQRRLARGRPTARPPVEPAPLVRVAPRPGHRGGDGPRAPGRDRGGGV